MANHCIDVLCLHCGRNWCCLCHDVYTPHTALQLTTRATRKATRHLPEVRIEDQDCPCGKPNIVIE